MSLTRSPIDTRWFSSGQQIIQQHIGTRQHAYHMAAHEIFSSFIPKHQQAWLADQPMIVASIRNPISQQVWVTPLFAHINIDADDDSSIFHPIVRFLPSKKSDTGTLVCIHAQSRSIHDPFDTHVVVSTQLALVFVDFTTRDRFRMNGRIERIDEKGNIYLRVKQSFGFCPKYVKRRGVDVERTINNLSHDENHSTTTTNTTTATATTSSPTTIYELTPLLNTHSPPFQPHLFASHDDPPFSLSHLLHAASQHDCVLPPPLVSWLLSCDDMFIGSSDPSHNNEVGYKGGSPGWLRVLDGRIIVYPDYFGNPFFTVLGNSITHPQMALCFMDFQTGYTLQISGVVSFQKHPDGAGMDLDGADRHVMFRITEWRFHGGVNRPIIWRNLDSSSHNYKLRDVPVVPLLHPHIITEFHARGMNEQDIENRFDTRLKRDHDKPSEGISSTITTTDRATSTIFHGTSSESPCTMRITAIVSEDHPIQSEHDISSQQPSILTYEFEVYPMDNKYTHIRYSPGQYATFDVVLPTGVHIRRSWTISKPSKRLLLQPSHDDMSRLREDMTYTRTRFCISVKRVPDGRVTPWLHEQVGVGTKLQLIGIEGTFVLTKQPSASATTTSNIPSSLLFFTAGVGITPAIAFLTAIHDLYCRQAASTSTSTSSLPSHITLFHSERSLVNIPFTSTLYQLLTHTQQNMHPVLSHLHVNITTSTSTSTIPDTSHLDAGFMEQLNASSSPSISMSPSRINLSDITSHMISHDVSNTHVYICGPHPYQQHIIHLLEQTNISSHNIHMEQFDY